LDILNLALLTPKEREGKNDNILILQPGSEANPLLGSTQFRFPQPLL
jgi:hypothetical protein